MPLAKLSPLAYPVQRAHHIDRGTPVNRVEFARHDEVLTGYVQGMKATDLEERWAQAATAEGMSFRFQVSYFESMGTAGEYRLDFLMYGLGMPRPVQIDGQFAHGTIGKQQNDWLKDAYFYSRLRGEVKRVLRVPWYNITNVDQARQIIRTRV